MAPHLNRLRTITHIVLDMDGTIYLGSTLFDFTVPFLSTLKALGLRFSFVTNNNARSASQYVKHLAQMGVEADLGNIYTSAHATIEYLRKNLPDETPCPEPRASLAIDIVMMTHRIRLHDSAHLLGGGYGGAQNMPARDW